MPGPALGRSLLAGAWELLGAAVISSSEMFQINVINTEMQFLRMLRLI